jgi:hypothetical protein
MLFVSNLQDAYSGSILVNTNADIRKIVDLDVNSSMPSSDVLLLTSSILKNSLNLSPTIFQSEVAESNNNPYELPLDSLSEIFAQ